MYKIRRNDANKNKIKKKKHFQTTEAEVKNLIKKHRNISRTHNTSNLLHRLLEIHHDKKICYHRQLRKRKSGFSAECRMPKL